MSLCCVLLAAIFFSTRLYNPMLEFRCFMFTLFLNRVDLYFTSFLGDIFRVCPFPVTVTTGIIPFVVGNPCKPLFATVTGKGPHPRYIIFISKLSFPKVRSLPSVDMEACMGGSQVLDLREPAKGSQRITLFLSFFLSFFLRNILFFGTTKVQIVMADSLLRPEFC